MANNSTPKLWDSSKVWINKLSLFLVSTWGAKKQSKMDAPVRPQSFLIPLWYHDQVLKLHWAVKLAGQRRREIHEDHEYIEPECTTRMSNAHNASAHFYDACTYTNLRLRRRSPRHPCQPRRRDSSSRWRSHSRSPSRRHCHHRCCRGHGRGRAQGSPPSHRRRVRRGRRER